MAEGSNPWRGDLVRWAPDLVAPPQVAPPASSALTPGAGPMVRARGGVLEPVGDRRIMVPHRSALPGTMMDARRRQVMITAVPIRVTTTGAQELRLAHDVLDIDELDLEL